MVMVTMRPETGLWPDTPVLWVLRLIVMPILIYAVVPICHYDATLIKRMIAVCGTLLSFLTIGLVVIGLAQLRVMTIGSVNDTFEPASPTDVLELISGVSILPGGMRADPMYVTGASVLEIGLITLEDGLLAQRARQHYESGDFVRNERFLLFSFFQFTILVLSITMAISVFAENRWYLIVAASLSIVCLFVDVTMFSSMERDYSARRLRMDGQMLQEQLDEYLTRYNAISGYVEDVAQRRHDIRNQLTIIAALADRGDFDTAQRHLDSLRRTRTQHAREFPQSQQLRDGDVDALTQTEVVLPGTNAESASVRQPVPSLDTPGSNHMVQLTDTPDFGLAVESPSGFEPDRVPAMLSRTPHRENRSALKEPSASTPLPSDTFNMSGASVSGRIVEMSNDSEPVRGGQSSDIPVTSRAEQGERR